MYHYGWLCEELTLISEMYADAMDVIRRKSLQFGEKFQSRNSVSSTSLATAFTADPELTKQYGYIRQYLGRAAGQFVTI